MSPELKRPQAEDDELQDAAFLGREFLTWLLWRVDAGDGDFGDFTMHFGGRARLGSFSGNVTDAVLKGVAPAHGVEARAAIGCGHTVREAELRLVAGEREWRFTLIGETLDLRGVKIPALLTEEEDDRFSERIALIQELDDLVQKAFRDFMGERVRPSWRKQTLAAMREWVVSGLETES
jgi:hypothetical protein